MANLKERLREAAKDRAQMERETPGAYARPPRQHIEWEAADYIEVLEATLRDIARTDDEGTVTHRLECRQRLARAVLEERG